MCVRSSPAALPPPYDGDDPLPYCNSGIANTRGTDQTYNQSRYSCYHTNTFSRRLTLLDWLLVHHLFRVWHSITWVLL